MNNGNKYNKNVNIFSSYCNIISPHFPTGERYSPYHEFHHDDFFYSLSLEMKLFPENIIKNMNDIIYLRSK